MNNEHLSRRRLLTNGSFLAAGAATGRLSAAPAADASNAPPATRPVRQSVDAQGRPYSEEHWDVPGEPGKDYTPVITPNGWTLPYKVVDGVKVFHLVTEEVWQEFAPGLKALCWGANGSVHGPTIECVEGDRVRIYVTNRLPAATAIHWHGILLPNGMDGVGGLTQPVIKPGQTFRYEFTVRQHGTHMYHSHHDEMTQMALGLMGLFIIHPRGVPPERRPDRDFAFMLSEWRIDPGTYRPNPNEMTDFNLLTLNAKVFPGTAPMVAKLGDKVRIRLGNLSAMDHHPIHLHGYLFHITETDGGPIQESAQWPEVTVLVPVGSTRTFEFVADNPGDWAFHCHMTHHVMNQMGHQFPNMIGMNPGNLDQVIRGQAAPRAGEKPIALLPGYMTMGQEGMGDAMEMAVPENSIPMMGGKGPFDYITMGGMFTVLKVRPDLKSYDDPGWYSHPAGTVATVAPAEHLRRDGVTGDGGNAPRNPNPVTPPQAFPTRGRSPDDKPGAKSGGHGHEGHGPAPAPSTPANE